MRQKTRRPVVGFGAVLVLMLSFAWWGANAVQEQTAAAEASGSGHQEQATPAQQQPMNPHSDLIFRATGATTCADCHRVGKGGELSPQVQDNAMVKELKAKAKGIHGPGRFADCLRCHPGGDKGVEKYRK
jgi:cytochrome c2